MAVAERDPQTEAEIEAQSNDDNDDEDEDGEVKTTGKREKVDLTKVDPQEKVVIAFHVPAEMKLRLMKDAESQGLTYTARARNVLAESLGYEIPSTFTERTRTRKYASEEERKAATAQRGKEQRAQVAKMLAAVKNKSIDPQVLAALGIDLSALGVD